MEKKKTQTGEKEEKKKSNLQCENSLCPIHGKEKIKLRGRIFQGNVTKKLHRRLVIEFERTVYIQKYERYEKRKTKLHARLPDCIKDIIQIGDLIEIAECRPLSKIVHFVVTKKIGGEEESSVSQI